MGEERERERERGVKRRRRRELFYFFFFLRNIIFHRVKKITKIPKSNAPKTSHLRK
jgi:hypothetical protein